MWNILYDLWSRRKYRSEIPGIDWGGSKTLPKQVEVLREMHCHNQRIYREKAVVDFYSGFSGLSEEESFILSHYRRELAGRAILDLGVGAGRTTPSLLRISSNYLGVDVAPEMIERCRGRYPSVTFRTGDARDLNFLAQGSFGFVFFSFNGIDYVGPQDRRAILEEVYRLLESDGIFIFSSHNLSWTPPSPWLPPGFGGSGGLGGVGRYLFSYFIHLQNYFKNRHRQYRCADYAILIDSAHECPLLTHYVDAEYQSQQLAEVGFTGIEMIGKHGKPLRAGDSHLDPWIHYLARKRTL